MPKKINVSIIGVTGYTGLELLRLLVQHPLVNIKYLFSHQHHGQKISDLYPHLKNVCELPLSELHVDEFSVNQLAKENDIIFLALPNTESQKIASKFLGKVKIIDLSGDFRIQNKELYGKYYGQLHQDEKNMSVFMYGLPEWQKDKIASAENIANPGCFAITAQLALLPLKDSIKYASILGITGSSGSGKTPKDDTHHPIRNHNVKSYKICTHQHIPEMIQTLNLQEEQISFIPTSGPFTRGIHITAFLELKKKISVDKVSHIFEEFYANAPFVRLKKEVQLAEVIGSNFCDIAIFQVNDNIVIQAVIDNLVKGAAGNALQNMNIMSGFEETAGLQYLSPLFP